MERKRRGLAGTLVFYDLARLLRTTYYQVVLVVRTQELVVLVHVWMKVGLLVPKLVSARGVVTLGNLYH